MRHPQFHSTVGTFLIAAVAFSTIAACAPASRTSPSGPGTSSFTTGSDSGLKGEPYTVGLAMPITGSQATFGGDQVQAALWGVDAVNKAGGINGRPLKFEVIDTQADPQTGVQAANRLIDVDKVPAFITAWSSVVSAVAPIANQNKILELSVGANSPEIARLGDFVYTTYPLANIDITAMADYSSDALHKTRAAVLYINNDTGKYAAQVYRKTFEAKKGKVVAYEAYQPNSTDYSGQIQKVLAANPDIVHIQGLVEDLPQVIAQMRQLGVTATISTYSAGYNPELVKKLGNQANGLLVTSLAPTAKDNPAVQKYLDKWTKDKGRGPNGLPYTMYLYDSAFLMRDLIKHVVDEHKDVNGTNLRDALLQVKTFNLPLTGATTFQSDHTVASPVTILQVKDGQFVPIVTLG